MMNYKSAKNYPLGVLDSIQWEAIDSREHSVYAYHKEQLQMKIQEVEGLNHTCARG